MILDDIYLNHTMKLSNLNIKHPWLDVVSEDTLVKLVRYFDVKELIPKKRFQDLHIYLDISPVNFMYPMFFFGTLLGYAFRSIEGKEFTVKNRYPMIAFTASTAVYNLKDYRGSKFQPLVLVEGVSDAEAVSQIYPWVIAVMGNKVKSTMTEILQWYTKEVYLLFDNDSAGRSGAEDSIKGLEAKGIKVRNLTYPKNCTYKDPAQIIGDGKRQIIKQMLKGAR